MNVSKLDAEEGEEDDTPKPDYKPPPVIPKEENRTGCNNFNIVSLYFENILCMQWT